MLLITEGDTPEVLTIDAKRSWADIHFDFDEDNLDGDADTVAEALKVWRAQRRRDTERKQHNEGHVKKRKRVCVCVCDQETRRRRHVKEISSVYQQLQQYSDKKRVCEEVESIKNKKDHSHHVVLIVFS